MHWWSARTPRQSLCCSEQNIVGFFLFVQNATHRFGKKAFTMLSGSSESLNPWGGGGLMTLFFRPCFSLSFRKKQCTNVYFFWGAVCKKISSPMYQITGEIRRKHPNFFGFYLQILLVAHFLRALLTNHLKGAFYEWCDASLSASLFSRKNALFRKCRSRPTRNTRSPRCNTTV